MRWAFVSIALLSGCTRDVEPGDAPTWVRLATRAVEYAPPDDPTVVGGRGRVERDDAGGWRFVWTLPPEAFEPDPVLAGVRIAAVPDRLAGFVVGEPSLTVGTLALEAREPSRRAWRDASETGGFALLPGRVYLRLPDGAPPSATARLVVPVAARPELDEPWRVRCPDYFADGFALPAGGAATVRFPRPAGSALTFQVAALPLGPADGRSARLVVRIDGELLLEREAPVGEPQLVRAALPPAAREWCTLDLRAAGGGAVVAVLEPVVGPDAVGTYGDRPWAVERPDLVVLLADTFRADNLTYYRGRPGGLDAPLSPRLDALGRESVRFRRAWAPAPWTLPSQASLLTGLEPLRHGAISAGARLPAAITTLAERLSRVGYRTANVNDQAFLAAEYGLDQGFQRHDERKARGHDLAATRARVESFLAADDGRPVFLYVQSYRAHFPYAAGERSRELVEAHLPVAVDAATGRGALDAALATMPDESRPPDPERSPFSVVPHAPTAAVEAAVAELHGLYRAGARETDAGFGALLDTLDARGLGATAYVLFTSDHGEAFGRQGVLFHMHSTVEALTRVPLFLRGPGLEPRDVEQAVSLLDVAPTFTRLAGLEPSPRWRGTSLLDVHGPRPLFIEECGLPSEPQSWTGLLGATKLYADGCYAEPLQVDLATDPAEERPLRSDDPGFETDLFLDLTRLREATTVPLHPRESTSPSPEVRAQLRALGYVDEGGEW